MVVSMNCRSFFMPEAYIALTPVTGFTWWGCWWSYLPWYCEKILHWSALPSFLESALLENAVWPGEYRPSSVPLFMPSVNLGRWSLPLPDNGIFKMYTGAGKWCPSYASGVKSHEDSGCFLVDLRRHYVCIFPIFVAVTGSCTGRSHCPSHCCAVGINTACSSHGNEPVWSWFCP